VDRKVGYARKRAMEAAGEVEMKDVDVGDGKDARGRTGVEEGEKMEVDKVR